MRELTPARVRQRKKMAARNRPAFMVLYRMGILHDMCAYSVCIKGFMLGVLCASLLTK